LTQLREKQSAPAAIPDHAFGYSQTAVCHPDFKSLTPLSLLKHAPRPEVAYAIGMMGGGLNICFALRAEVLVNRIGYDLFQPAYTFILQNEDTKVCFMGKM
jgi:hypothetical protein